MSDFFAKELVMRNLYTLSAYRAVCDFGKPPLCKGRWRGEAVTEGLRCGISTISNWFLLQSTCEKK